MNMTATDQCPAHHENQLFKNLAYGDKEETPHLRSDKVSFVWNCR